MMFHPRRVLFRFLLLLAAALACTATSPADVHVRGYTRKDGTYVRPHHRSNPDGNFSNNWSTKGNVNPYTGEWGTKVAPPSGYGGQSTQSRFSSTPLFNYDSPSSAAPIRNAYVDSAGPNSRTESTSEAAQTQKSPGLGNDSAESSPHIEQQRKLQAKILEQLGQHVNWEDYSYAELADMVERIRLAETLARMGHQVDWKKHSYMEMIDMVCRIRAAAELKRLGYNVNWQDYSHARLLQYRLEIHRLRSGR